MPLQKIGEMERVQYEGQFLPLLPPMGEGRGGSCPPAPSVGVPGSYYSKPYNEASTQVGSNWNVTLWKWSLLILTGALPYVVSDIFLQRLLTWLWELVFCWLSLQEASLHHYLLSKIQKYVQLHPHFHFQTQEAGFITIHFHIIIRKPIG